METGAQHGACTPNDDMRTMLRLAVNTMCQFYVLSNTTWHVSVSFLFTLPSFPDCGHRVAFAQGFVSKVPKYH